MLSELSATWETFLTALSAGELYGLELADLIESYGGREVNAGTLYPVLKRLEAAGLVSSRWGDEVCERGGARRRYYSLTQEGRDRLEQIRGMRNSLYYRKEEPNEESLAAIAEAKNPELLESYSSVEDLMCSTDSAIAEDEQKPAVWSAWRIRD